MRTRRTLAAAALFTAAALCAWVGACGRLTPDTQAQNKPGGKTPDIPPRFDEPANLPLAGHQPTKETAQSLRDELLYQRATQSYLWALPLLNMRAMKEASE